MTRVLDWDPRTLPRACGQFVQDQAGIWRKVRCDEVGWQVGFLHRLDPEEACRLLNEVQAWLPHPTVNHGCTCSGWPAEPAKPGNPFQWEMWEMES